VRNNTWERTWSKVDETGKRMASEVSVTIRLAGEISRLEVVGSGHEPLDRVGVFQTALSQGLDSEYYAVKSELTEGDREGDIESYLDDMRGSSY
jgi:hypothetical protein